MTSERASITLNLLLMLTENGGDPIRLADLAAQSRQTLTEDLMRGVSSDDTNAWLNEVQVPELLKEMVNTDTDVIISGLPAHLTTSADLQFTLQFPAPGGTWTLMEDDPERLIEGLNRIKAARHAWEAALPLYQSAPAPAATSEPELTPEPVDAPHAHEEEPSAPHGAAEQGESTDSTLQLSAEALLAAQRLATQDGVSVHDYVNELILFQE